MIGNLLFLQQLAHALQAANFPCRMKNNAVGGNLEVIDTTLSQLSADGGLFGPIDFLDVQNQFINFERVIVDLSQFNLPGADIGRFIQHMLQFIEINERPLELVEFNL